MLLRISWREEKTALPQSSNNQRPWIPAVINNKENLLNAFHTIRKGLHHEVPFGSANPDSKTSPDSKEAGTPVMSVKPGVRGLWPHPSSQCVPGRMAASSITRNRNTVTPITVIH